MGEGFLASLGVSLCFCVALSLVLLPSILVHNLKSKALQWPRSPKPLSDESLAEISDRVASPQWQADFNRSLDTICVERQPGTDAHANVRKFIVSELRALDWTIDENGFSAQTPHGRKPFTNIVATFDTVACHRLVLACHYDSKVMEDFVGATDSAVPCSQMLSIVKMLEPELKAHRDRKSGLTLQLIFFDGEEAFQQWSSTDSLYGSRHLADLWHKSRFVYSTENQCQDTTGDRNLVSELDRIELFVLLDLLGTKKPSFTSFFADTRQLFDQMAQLERRFNALKLMDGRTTYFTNRSVFGVIEDDHIPFMRKDVPILHLIPHPFPNVWHRTTDNKSALDWPTIWNLNRIFTAFVAWYMEL